MRVRERKKERHRYIKTQEERVLLAIHSCHPAWLLEVLIYGT